MLFGVFLRFFVIFFVVVYYAFECIRDGHLFVSFQRLLVLVIVELKPRNLIKKEKVSLNKEI